MAVKYFCDACGNQINDTANRKVWFLEFNRSPTNHVKVEVEAMVAINGTTNGGHICVDCIKKTIKDGLVKGKVTR